MELMQFLRERHLISERISTWAVREDLRERRPEPAEDDWNWPGRSSDTSTRHCMAPPRECPPARDSLAYTSFHAQVSGGMARE